MIKIGSSVIHRKSFSQIEHHNECLKNKPNWEKTESYRQFVRGFQKITEIKEGKYFIPKFGWYKEKGLHCQFVVENNKQNKEYYFTKGSSK